MVGPCAFCAGDRTALHAASCPARADELALAEGRVLPTTLLPASAVKREKRARHLAVAALPDGSRQVKETTHVYTHAIAIDVPRGTAKADAAVPPSWLVCQWSKDEARLRQAAKKLEAQWHGARQIRVVPVTIEEVTRIPKRKIVSPPDPEGLTDKQWEALKTLAYAGPQSVFDFGSSTVHRLREAGWASTVKGAGRIAVTDEGRERVRRGR